jgi:hypothetical protein
MHIRHGMPVGEHPARVVGVHTRRPGGLNWAPAAAPAQACHSEVVTRSDFQGVDVRRWRLILLLVARYVRMMIE